MSARQHRVTVRRAHSRRREFRLASGDRVTVASGVAAEEVYGLINDDFDDSRPPQAVGLTLESGRRVPCQLLTATCRLRVDGPALLADV